ncbi:MAG: GxxExxY protein, partial [Verrucomicrobiota bacterium]
GLDAEAQKPINVYYEGYEVGHFTADIFVQNNVIVELKAVRKLADIHEVQVVNYLTATGKDIGLLLNFGSPSLEIKRKHKDYQPKS